MDTHSIIIYVEPVGYGFKEGVDDEGNIFVQFSATITVSDNQGNLLTEPIPAGFGEHLNS